MNCIVYLYLFFMIHFVNPNPVVNGPESNVFTDEKHIEDAFLKKLNIKCSERDNSSCIMLKLITYMNRMLKKSSIFIDENIELVQTRMVTPNTEKYSSLKLARSQSSDEATLSVLVADKLWSFFKSRSLKWKVFNLADFVMGSDDDGQLNIGLSVNSKKLYEEGRGKLKNSGHIIGALLAKAALVGALIFKGLVLLVGKALIVSKLAFLLASILAVKKLLSKKHITYEVVAHPVHDLHHEHPTSGWGRALDELIDNQMNFISGDQIAYKGHQ